MPTSLPQSDTIDCDALLRTLKSVRKGDFSVRLRLKRAGTAGEVVEALNDIIEMNERLSDEIDRISVVVGKQGRIRQRASTGPVTGRWAQSIGSLNSLIEDLVQPTSEVARVIGAVAKGDLSQTMPLEIEGRPLRGAFRDMADTVNTMVKQLGSFASEVTRVAREVGTEGKLGGQAVVRGMGGIWQDLTENVNRMASNLTSQVRNIAAVTTAVANGDLSQKITVEVQGEILQLKNTINTMVDQLRSFASEVTRVAREVGSEGKLGVQAEVKGVGGVWKDLTNNVNSMAANLTGQVRNIADVTKAVAQGDLSKKITVSVKGEILDLKDTINTMVDQLNAFAGEVTRVAREVGTEGKLGGQAQVKGVAGVWKDLTDNVNSMASNLTGQVRNIAEVTTAVANGDLSRKITVDVRGEILALKNTINTMVDQLNGFASEVTRVAREVGFEGKLGGQAEVPGVAGVWKDLTNNVNFMAGNLTSQVRNIKDVTRAIAKGDLSKKITVDVRGEILELKNTINTMVDQLNAFAGEVTRVAREVGTEGKLGGQAKIKGVAGVWKDLTNNVNLMARNITNQVRNIAKVNRAIAKGDLSKKITIRARGEMADLKVTINNTVDLLNRFAGEVTRVAREVGTEGKLGGQAKVKGVAGVWKDLTNNVNFMAGNLTNQVRNIAWVTTAVANGDLSRKITVEVRGEILELKNTVNTMVDQLRSFASEVTRVAREVGVEGKLGGQARVKGVGGVWKDLTDNVNSMASNLTGQVRNIVEVTTAVAQGDLSKKITVDVRGEILELKRTINTMVDRLNSFASEVTRVAREVGTEGKLGGQAQVKGVAGVWKGLTENVNFMAANLTSQVRNISEVTSGLAKGDLSKKITVEAQGEILALKNTINSTVDVLDNFAGEVTRVAREVGFEGKLGGQAKVKGVAGVWKDLTNNVNFMAGNLTGQVRNIVEVTKAVAQGDLSKKITVDVRGEILELKQTINTMVDQLNSFASEVTRVAREVGTEGKLGGQAQVKGVAGVWKGLTDNVNSMAANLTGQVRNIAEVTTAVAKGDLSKKITVEVQGEILALKDTINTMVDQLRSFASEVTRVAREVGVEGNLGGQAEVRGVAGVWKDLTNNVNLMAGNLTSQVRNIADVTTAVANGDLSRKITVDVRGEILELKNTINTMVDQLRSFASEVTRVAREVGTEGKLGGQAQVKGVAGVWKGLTDNVNSMASNLTGQVRNIAEVTTAVARGNLSKKITVDVKGEILELKDTINTMVDQLNSFASEVTRVAREVGTEGKLGGQAQVKGVGGVWKDLTDNVNSMASNLTSQVRNIAEVTTAVANGDLSRKITVPVRGEILQLKRTINTMVDQLNSFASEVTRVAREVGTEGKLGGQAQVKGVGGVWKDLTDNVNMMAFNLTTQVRRIAKVVTAVAVGNLKQKLPLEARGEIAALADTINDMIDTLATFADQVTTVAREVGVEGKLGGQARVPGATGIWRDLTDNVNQLAANLTTQVRAIADVSTAVTKGDLSQTITVQAQGEVAALKDNINQMIRNLAETTHLNAEQDWLKTNLARFSRLLQGQRDLQAAARLTLSEVSPLVNAQIGAFFGVREDGEVGREPVLFRLGTYGRSEESVPETLKLGDGLIGQVGRDKRRIVIENARLLPAIGQVLPSKTTNLVVFPILFEGQVKGIIELASVGRFSDIHLTFLEQLAETIGIVMNTIMATQRTETLLNQSLALSRELQSRQAQLQDTNAELEDKARLLSEQKKEVETKNREIEVARSAIEEKAEQLALTSKYKSQFLANMSHELRTPLNSLLILARTLSENGDRNLSPKQVEYSQTIYASGKELLLLINDILDLSKIESGTISLEMTHVSLREVQDYVERNFRPLAEDKRLEFAVELDAGTPATIYTDAQRLKQVLRNLLSNALKFTAMGRVSLRIGEAKGGWFPENPVLSAAKSVIAFSVTDTGIGVPSEKQKIIFEAFQQVDMTTSRKYGGTGLGLSISRKIAEMLGGELSVESVPGKGSTFTLFVPFAYAPIAIAEPQPEAASEETRGAVQGVPQAELPAREAPVVADDRDAIGKDDRVLLAVIGEPGISADLLESAHDSGFKVIVVNSGESGLSLGLRRSPHAVFLDPRLPDLDGWVVFDRLKHDPRTRHIPVCLLAREGDTARAFRQGAFGVIKRPLQKSALSRLLRRLRLFIGRESRSVLIVEESESQRRRLTELLAAGGVRVEAVDKAQGAVAALRKQRFDCMVVDPTLPEMKGGGLIETIHGAARTQDLPIIVDARGGLAKRDEEAFKRDPRVVVVRDDESAGRVIDAVALLLHQDEAKMPEAERLLVEKAQSEDPGIAGKKILIVDDDPRNIFALASLLERHHAEVLHAENGKEGLQKLHDEPGVDLVLMDIMMPGMDGYEAMRAIRGIPAFTSLPIIALTAKAMRGDREKCLQAGASEYIPKPVDVDLLMSLTRVWLNR